MRTFSSVKNLPVVTLKEGGHAGKLDDFLVDLRSLAVLGFRARAPGFWSGDVGVAAEAVVLLGRDYVLVTKDAAVEAGEASDPAEGHAWWSSWSGAPVMNRRGMQVGTVEDAVVQATPRKVLAFVVDGGRLVAPGPRVVVGDDSVVVEDDSLVVALVERSESAEWWKKVEEILAAANPVAR